MTDPYVFQKMRRYADSEITRLRGDEIFSDEHLVYNDGQVAALIKFKSKFLLDDHEAAEIERTRREMMGDA